MFTKDEVELLQKGLDALKSNGATNALLGQVMGSVMIQEKEARDKFLKECDEKNAERKASESSMNERIILLKAKLIQIKDAAAVEALTSSDPEDL